MSFRMTFLEIADNIGTDPRIGHIEPVRLPFKENVECRADIQEKMTRILGKNSPLNLYQLYTRSQW